MKILNELEVAVVDHFNLTANYFSMGELDGQRDQHIENHAVYLYCQEIGHTEIDNDAKADTLMRTIESKVCCEEDSISLESTAAWILSHYLTAEQLRAMSDKDIEYYLRNWKYWFGFRKCDGWGEYYRQLALEVLDGSMVLDPFYDKDDPEYWYTHRENLD